MPYPPLPLHPLHSHPLPCPLPYTTISIRTSLGAEMFPSATSPSHPIQSTHLPALIPYPTVPSALLPYPLLPSPLFSHLPSHLLRSTQRFRKKSKTKMLWYHNVKGQKLFGANRLLEDWNDPQPQRSRKRGGPKRLGPNRFWPDLNFCVTKHLGRNGFHVTKRLLTAIVWYRSVLLPIYNTRWTSPPRIQCKPIYTYVYFVNLVCERNYKIQQENSCFYFLRCLTCKLT